MSKEAYYEKILESTRRYCSKSEKCKFDVYKRLQYSSLDDEQKNNIVSLLEAERFIDEERYAKAFVNDKFKFNKWGKLKIAHALRSKNISENIIENSLLLINEKEYINILKDLLINKNSSKKNIEPIKRKASLIRYASGRGFEYDFINSVLDKMFLS